MILSQLAITGHWVALLAAIRAGLHKLLQLFLGVCIGIGLGLALGLRLAGVGAARAVFSHIHCLHVTQNRAKVSE